MADRRPDTPASLLVTSPSRGLRRSLGPLAWAVLEDVALDASVDEEGRWVAQTSTRRVAAHLGMTPGAAGRALARLCAQRLVAREDRRHAATGRFLESAYVLAPVPGLVLLSPCSTSPPTVTPDTALPPTAFHHAGAGGDGGKTSTPSDSHLDQLTLLPPYLTASP